MNSSPFNASTTTPALETTSTITIEQENPPSSSKLDRTVCEEGGHGLVLRLTNGVTDSGPRVQWAADTVDNELMGKKKSKCCCIYKKPKRWDESSDSDHSDSDCETGHCRGHVEKRPELPSQGPSSSQN